MFLLKQLQNFRIWFYFKARFSLFVWDFQILGQFLIRSCFSINFYVSVHYSIIRFKVPFKKLKFSSRRVAKQTRYHPFESQRHVIVCRGTCLYHRGACLCYKGASLFKGAFASFRMHARLFGQTCTSVTLKHELQKNKMQKNGPKLKFSTPNIQISHI